MPRPRKIIETNAPLGVKLNLVMDAKGIAGDYEKLAEAFGVTVASAREWVQHGRFAKARFARLVEWSGRSLHWWFDVPFDVTDAAPTPRSARSGDAPMSLARDTEPTFMVPYWPFTTITPEEFRRLSSSARREIEAFARGVLSQKSVARNGTA